MNSISTFEIAFSSNFLIEFSHEPRTGVTSAGCVVGDAEEEEAQGAAAVHGAGGHGLRQRG